MPSDVTYDRVSLAVDGNCGSALLGPNIQQGECEFVEVCQGPDEPLHKAEIRACWEAYQKLLNRLGKTRNELSYYWYPRKPGTAGA